MTDEKKDYKATLNLPKTKFGMKANLAQNEPQRLKQWQKNDLYGQVRRSRAGRDKFVLHDGPPYANGDIHIGHAVNKILKDIIIKSKTLSGFDAPYVPGWDCHGLPIEHKVEQKIGRAGDKVDASTFRKKCRDYAFGQVKKQKADFMRLGVLGDWDNPYLTADKAVEANIVRALGKIVENGHLHKGVKPVYWSVVGGSALAEAEVEYQDKTSWSIDVAYPVASESRAEMFAAFSVDSELPAAVVIWTTTPWTLPSSQAVSIHPDFEYVLARVVKDGSERLLIVAEELLQDFAKRAELTQVESLAVCAGSALKNVRLQHPFYDQELPTLLGEHVTLDAGTGCVHTAPDHGEEDFLIGRRNGLGILNNVDDRGIYRDKVELFAGEHVYKVDTHVIEVVKDHKNLMAASQFQHSYPHCWRTKTPLIYRATPQWFISMTQAGLLDRARELTKDVEWFPAWGQARFEGMLDSSPDWCISRQRTWGVPIALFVHKETQELHPRTPELIEQVAQRVEADGMDAWFEADPADYLGDEATEYSKVTDTLDVWFDSGVTHATVLRQWPDLAYPADLYLEGSDQHRGWFQSSMKTSIATDDCAPYRQVLTHGFTVDGRGRKMSKSLGNVMAPQQVTNSLGADVLRLWVSATDFSTEMTVSDEILKRTSDSYRRIRNTARYMLANLDGFDPEHDVLDTDALLPLDRWAIDCAAKLQAQLREDYDAYRLHLVYQKLHKFCVNDMGAFYLDVIKDRIYTCAKDSLARRSAQTAIYHVVNAFVRWIAPVLSFTADELWQHLPSAEGSVFTTEWYDALVPATDQPLSSAQWALVMQVRDEVNKRLEEMRAVGEIKGSLEAKVDLLVDDPALKEILEILGDELRFVLITSQACVVEMSETASETGLKGLKLSIQRAAGEKCVRCWHFQTDIGDAESDPELCGRCVENVVGAGEERRIG